MRQQRTARRIAGAQGHTQVVDRFARDLFETVPATHNRNSRISRLVLRNCLRLWLASCHDSKSWIFVNAFLTGGMLLARFSAAQTAQVHGRTIRKSKPESSKLLQQMTLEEKAGQMTQFSIGTPTGPGTGRSDYKEMVAKGEVGSILNMTGAAQTNAMQKIAVEQSRLHIPLIFGLDIIHGYRTSFPIPLGLSATWNPELIERIARLAAQEGSRAGIRWTFSPMVDIARDARWGRIAEGAGEDPYLGSAIAAAYVRGYRARASAIPIRSRHAPNISQDTVRLRAAAITTPRKFPIGCCARSISRRSKLRQHAGAATFMSAFEALNEVPSTENAFTLKTVLRDEWNFRGLVVSDYGAVAELIPQGVALDGATAARKAAIAGVDMDMESNLYRTQLPAAGTLGRGAAGSARRSRPPYSARKVRAWTVRSSLYTRKRRRGKAYSSSESRAGSHGGGAIVCIAEECMPGNGTPVLPLEASAQDQSHSSGHWLMTERRWSAHGAARAQRKT